MSKIKTRSFQRQTQAGFGGRCTVQSAHQPSKHFQLGKDYAHAAHRHAGGESMLRGRIVGKLIYPQSQNPPATARFDPKRPVGAGEC
jgi:hypothetical protein